MEEDVEHSIAMMVSMDDWRGKAESRIFNLTLSELLSNTRFGGASDPKDKVFALLSLASDVDLKVSTMKCHGGIYLWVSHDIPFHKALHLISYVGKESPNPQGK